MKKNPDKAKDPGVTGDASLKSLLDAVSMDKPLPASGTELILLEVDPHRAHAYWNIDPGLARTGLPLVLRVYDITESGRSDLPSQVFDIEVYGLQGRWYLDLWRDDRVFLSEIGYRNTDGSLSVLARSNEVRTPAAAPVENASAGLHVDHRGDPLHTEWPGDVTAADTVADLTVPSETTIPDAAPEAVEIEASAPTNAVPATPPPLVAEPIVLLPPEFPLPAWPHLSESPEEPVDDTPFFSDAAIAAGDAAVAFADEIMSGGSEPEASDSRSPDAGDNVEQEPFFPSPEDLMAAVSENHAALQAFYEESGTEAFAPAEPEPESKTPSDAPAPEFHPHHEAGSTPAPVVPVQLEQVIGLSSLEHMNKDVLLEVNAELHIYGRSKPNTELTLYGQVVRTRPDGTFSVRRPLPHGAVVVPLLYTKSDT